MLNWHEDVLSATNNFDDENFRGGGGFGNHYEGQLLWSGELIKIHAQRWNKEWDEKEQFWIEISMLSSLKHKNVVSLVGFCDENDELIIIIKLETMFSLDNYLDYTMMLTWVRRLEICLGVAHALSYIHYDESRDFNVIHRNIDSETVQINDNFEPKLSEFRLSMKIEASGRHHSFHVNKVWDIEGHTDPAYIETNNVGHKSDIYSFGIVMFELLCGRKSIITDEGNKYLAPSVILHYREEKLNEIIYWDLQKQIDPRPKVPMEVGLSSRGSASLVGSRFEFFARRSASEIFGGPSLSLYCIDTGLLLRVLTLEEVEEEPDLTVAEKDGALTDIVKLKKCVEYLNVIAKWHMYRSTKLPLM